MFVFDQGGESPKFSKISAMYSELVAVGVNGQLYQWKWNESEPYKHAEVSAGLGRGLIFL